MAPAKTGRDKRSSTTVIRTAHTNKGRFPQVEREDLMLITVAIKFIAPIIELAPAR